MTDDEIGSITDVARWLGVPYRRVVQWRYRHQAPMKLWPKFPDPEPSIDSAARPRFRRSKVEAWWAARPRTSRMDR